jgi:hypothetical protein
VPQTTTERFSPSVRADKVGVRSGTPVGERWGGEIDRQVDGYPKPPCGSSGTVPRWRESSATSHLTCGSALSTARTGKFSTEKVGVRTSLGTGEPYRKEKEA